MSLIYTSLTYSSPLVPWAPGTVWELIRVSHNLWEWGAEGTRYCSSLYHDKQWVHPVWLVQFDFSLFSSINESLSCCLLCYHSSCTLVFSISFPLVCSVSLILSWGIWSCSHVFNAQPLISRPWCRGSWSSGQCDLLFPIRVGCLCVLYGVSFSSMFCPRTPQTGTENRS